MYNNGHNNVYIKNKTKYMQMGGNGCDGCMGDVLPHDCKYFIKITLPQNLLLFHGYRGNNMNDLIDELNFSRMPVLADTTKSVLFYTLFDTSSAAIAYANEKFLQYRLVGVYSVKNNIDVYLHKGTVYFDTVDEYKNVRVQCFCSTVGGYATVFDTKNELGKSIKTITDIAICDSQTKLNFLGFINVASKFAGKSLNGDEIVETTTHTLAEIMGKQEHVEASNQFYNALELASK